MKKYDLTITKDNIIETLKSDKIGRVKDLLLLLRVINSINTNYIMSIDGKWGSGKTFLMKQLMYIYSNEVMDDKTEVIDFKNKYIPIYYNAWENDDHDNVLESLTFSFLNEYKEYEKQIVNIDFKEYKETILKNIISMFTGGIISKDSFDNFDDFKSLADSIYTIEEKKDAINELYNDLIGEKRLLLIVDELDRCKPDYAVKVLETLKHFYKNEKITILVVTDNTRLAETIKHFYGYGINGCEYLNRIYDNVIPIPACKYQDYVNYYSNLPNGTWLSKDFSILLFKYFGFSYRDCNRFFTMYDMCINYIEYKGSFNPNDYLFESRILVPYAIALKIHDFDKYDRFIKENAESDLDDFIKYLKNDNNVETRK